MIEAIKLNKSFITPRGRIDVIKVSKKEIYSGASISSSVRYFNTRLLFIMPQRYKNILD